VDLRSAKPDSRGAAGQRRHRPSRRRRVLAAVAVLLLALAGLTARLFVWPAEGMPAHVDAIVMPAGPGDRLPVALRLARADRAAYLVVSEGWQGYGGPCPKAVPGVRVICFEPDPGDTRGEAEYTGRLAREYHWKSVVLVTSTVQDTRARIVFGRCFGGSIYAMTASMPLGSMPYEVSYEWAALVKALFVYRGC